MTSSAIAPTVVYGAWSILKKKLCLNTYFNWNSRIGTLDGNQTLRMSEFMKRTYVKVVEINRVHTESLQRLLCSRPHIFWLAAQGPIT